MFKPVLTIVGALAMSLVASSGFAADCSKVSFSDVGWTDITTTTATTKHVLEALGYKVDVKVLSVPVTLASLKSGDVDVFLGNWIPAQTKIITPYVKKGQIDVVATNLTGTKYTLAVPTYTYNQGLKSYADIHKFRKQLDGKIYGIEPGNQGNAYLISLTKKNTYGLKGFKVVESSEQGMLAEVRRHVAAHKDIVFLGWEPHPMNANFSLKYLPGGESYFGGAGIVRTVTRSGYVKQCPNVGRLLKNIKFSLPMENVIMGKILDDKEKPANATLEWMKKHPDFILSWLDGVKTVDGKDGKAAVKAALGL